MQMQLNRHQGKGATRREEMTGAQRKRAALGHYLGRLA